MGNSTVWKIVGAAVAIIALALMYYFGFVRKSPPSSGTGGGRSKGNGNIPTDQQ
jgi:hypothetical protein